MLSPRAEDAALRKNLTGKKKNMARLRFVVRSRGAEWVKQQIEKEYQDILSNGGIPIQEAIPEGFGGFQSVPPPLGNSDLLPMLSNRHSNPDYARWIQTSLFQRNSW